MLPMTTWFRGSGSGSLPGSNSMAASPTKPTATTEAEASIFGVILSGRLTETITFPTSARAIFSTLPTGTPEIRTTELALRLAASRNWIL